MKALIRIILCVSVLSLLMDPAQAQEKRGRFRDTLDNAFDISNWLYELYGFIPLVAPITEPAVGYGNIHLKYYGSGDNLLADDPANFSIYEGY